MGVLNLILKEVKEPSEPERGAKAHEVRRSAELREICVTVYQFSMLVAFHFQSSSLYLVASIVSQGSGFSGRVCIITTVTLSTLFTAIDGKK